MADITITRRLWARVHEDYPARRMTSRHVLSDQDIAQIVKALSFYANDGACKTEDECEHIWELVELLNHKAEWTEG